MIAMRSIGVLAAERLDDRTSHQIAGRHGALAWMLVVAAVRLDEDHGRQTSPQRPLPEGFMSFR